MNIYKNHVFKKYIESSISMSLLNYATLHICVIEGLGKRTGYDNALLFGRSRDRYPVLSLGIFAVVSPTEPCVLRSTQPLKMSTRDLSWGKGGHCVRLTTYHPRTAEYHENPGS